jgi:hypothetical protein
MLIPILLFSFALFCSFLTRATTSKRGNNIHPGACFEPHAFQRRFFATRFRAYHHPSKCLLIEGSSFRSSLKSSRQFIPSFLTFTLSFLTLRVRSSPSDHQTCDVAAQQLTGLPLPRHQTAKQTVSLVDNQSSRSTFHLSQVRSHADLLVILELELMSS